MNKDINVEEVNHEEQVAPLANNFEEVTKEMATDE